MRIISGKKRGLRLAAVGKGDLAAHLRPTSDRVRESIFNLLMGGAYGDPITDARVLDLFAGTGALGLEAWSRGATHVTFVDDGAKAWSLLRQNIDLCGARNDTQTLRRNATRLTPCPGDPFGLIFLDPPYGQGLGQAALSGALTGGWLAPDCVIVVEDSCDIAPPPGFCGLDQRRYGDTHVTIIGLGE
jgi:16S rRNA (guanine966-N2)-methyltransferase